MVSKPLWGEERVTLKDADGTLRSVPIGWTDFEPPDPYLSLGGGRSRFRVDDLRVLASLVVARSGK